MTTYGQFVDDVLVALGMSQDDSLWYRDSVLQNTLYAEAKLVTQSLQGDTGPSSDGRSASRQLSLATVPVFFDSTGGGTGWKAMYFDLPSEVYDLPHDKGVNFVRYHRPSLPVSCPPSIAETPFNGTTLASLVGVYQHPRLRPREDRPYFARARFGNIDRVYLFGVSPLITNVIVGLFATPRFTSVSFDDAMQANPQQLFTLKRMVMEMGIWPLGIPQERLKNDGADFGPNQVVNTRPIISVNDPAMIDTPQQQ